MIPVQLKNKMTAGDRCGYILLVSFFSATATDSIGENRLSTEKSAGKQGSCDKAPHPVTETSGSLNPRLCSVARPALRTSSAESSGSSGSVSAPEQGRRRRRGPPGLKRDGWKLMTPLNHEAAERKTKWSLASARDE